MDTTFQTFSCSGIPYVKTYQCSSVPYIKMGLNNGKTKDFKMSPDTVAPPIHAEFKKLSLKSSHKKTGLKKKMKKKSRFIKLQ